MAAVQVFVSLVGDFAATRRALQETLLDEERLVDFLYGTGILSDGRADGGEAYRTSLELVDDREEDSVVDLVEAVAVYIEGPRA